MSTANPTNFDADTAALPGSEFDPSREQADPASGPLSELDKNVRTFVSEHPVLAVAGAVTVGLVLGRLLSRR